MNTAFPTLPLRLENVVKTFVEPTGVLRVLDGLCLELRTGEIVVLQGPSGSGKTTLLQIAGGLMRADSGAVQLAGRDISRATEAERTEARRRHLGFVFQHFHLVEALTVERNVALGLRFKRLPVEEQRIRGVLDRLGLGGKGRKLPRDLSGGEKQRVAFARALVGLPKLLLADEPTSQLDSNAAEAIATLMREVVNDLNVAVVVATHDPRLNPIAHRICRLNRGRIDE
jgi:putative ABC transport system ATP-binding protein